MREPSSRSSEQGSEPLRGYRTLNVSSIIAMLPIEPDHVVAHVGCGTGFFTFHFCEFLKQGHVLAFDIDERMVETVRRAASERKVANIEVKKSDQLVIPIDSVSVDGAFVNFVLHESKERVAFLKEIKRVVKPGGWIGLLERAVADKLSHGIDSDEAKRVAREAGFNSVQERDVEGRYYLLILQKCDQVI